MKLQNVVRVEVRETVTETVRQHKRHDYARGGYKIEETIHRVTKATPFALLGCGHWRQERNSGTVISTAQRLECTVCAQAEWDRAMAERNLCQANA
jgi:hypothetical protein